MDKKHKLVLIEWEDSVLGFQGWKEISDNLNLPTQFISVGFLVSKSKEKITLYPHIEDSEEINIVGAGDITIPTSAIRKIVYLKTK